MRERFRFLFTTFEREAWVRFFLALFGLALAFASALLSTAARESGNLLATAVLASSALLLAAFVGLVTVPYLARRVAFRRVRDVLDYDVTKEGLVYLALTFVISIAALNTGNNLLLIVVSAMLAAILVSGISSALVLRGLELEVSLPNQIFAKRLVSTRLSVRNARKFLPSFSVSVVPPKVVSKKKWQFRRTEFVYPSRRSGKKPIVRWPDLSMQRQAPEDTPPGIYREKVYFPYIAAGDTGHADVDLHFEKRGRYAQDHFGLATRFPFSFLTKTRRVPMEREVIVFPSVEPTDELFEILPLITGEFESYLRGRGYDLYRIREYQPEDSARHVDWKSTAKSGSLKLREFTREDERRLRIVFDNPAPAIVGEATYEDAVALAASLAWHFADENAELSFAAAGFNGSGDLFQFLEYLALVQPSTGKSVLDTLEVREDYNLVFTARPRGSIPTALWQSSYFLFIEDK